MLLESLSSLPGMAVRKPNYPGLPSSKNHEIARSQMTGFGAMLSFELDETQVRAGQFLRRLKLILPRGAWEPWRRSLRPLRDVG